MIAFTKNFDVLPIVQTLQVLASSVRVILFLETGSWRWEIVKIFFCARMKRQRRPDLFPIDDLCHLRHPAHIVRVVFGGTLTVVLLNREGHLKVQIGEVHALARVEVVK